MILPERKRYKLFTGQRAVAMSQREMTQNKKKSVCQGRTPWKTGIFLGGRVELFTGMSVSCWWVPKRDETGWSESCMPRCNTLRNGYLPERKGWVLSRRAVAESQKRMSKRMERMNARQIKKTEKKSIKRNLM